MDNPIAFDNIDVIINNGNIDSYLSEIGEFSIYSQPLEQRQYEQLTGHFTTAIDTLLKYEFDLTNQYNLIRVNSK